ncbi:MAG: Obg family GTPase CgtA [Vampirovibrionales bacterium]
MTLIDRATIHIQAGRGGNGLVSWRREKYVAYGGPAGGDGGRGGSVYLWANPHMTTLLDFVHHQHFEAKPGEKGGTKNCHGRGAEDMLIGVPCGTQVIDATTGQLIADLLYPYQRVLVAKGGRGGRGNARFATPKRQAPYFAEPGEEGIARKIRLEMKLIADVGIIGFPNAGKSTLISTISRAKPKIADYPFTTLAPNLGVVYHPRASHQSLVVADIPGLIPGASQGQGLGHAFLRHVERTSVLVHLMDMSEVQVSVGDFPHTGELDDPENCKLWAELIATHCWEKAQAIQHELEAFSPLLAEKPQLWILSKTDVLPQTLTPYVEAWMKEKMTQAGLKYPLRSIASVTRVGLEALTYDLFEYVGTSRVQHTLETKFQEAHAHTMGKAVVHHGVTYYEVETDTRALHHPEDPLKVLVYGAGVYGLSGTRLMKWVPMIHWAEAQSVHAFTNLMRMIGVFDALKAAGAMPGDTVLLGDQEMDFWPEDMTEVAGVRTYDTASLTTEEDDALMLGSFAAVVQQEELWDDAEAAAGNALYEAHEGVLPVSYTHVVRRGVRQERITWLIEETAYEQLDVFPFDPSYEENEHEDELV